MILTMFLTMGFNHVQIPTYDLTNDLVYFERRSVIVIFYIHNIFVKQISSHVVEVRRRLAKEKHKILRKDRKEMAYHRYTSHNA
jgi:hypothetical protein